MSGTGVRDTADLTVGAGWGRPGPQWFVVVPDTDAGAAVTAQLPEAPQRTTHPSGRPWLLGDWDPRDLRVGTAGRVRLAVLGPCSADVQELSRLAGRIRDVHDVPRVVGDLSGSFHVLASVEGVTSARGTLSGVRRVFFARVDGTAVAADRADVLARLVSAELDVGLLALRLLVLTDSLPTPEDSTTLWRGVTAVPEDSQLTLERDGRPRVERRWSPPEPDLPLDQGAPVLRETLDSAVHARTGLGRRLSADLSGGLDSTTICYLVSRTGHPITTFTTDTGDPRDDDPKWADLAAAGLPDARRIVASEGDLPLHYADLTDSAPPLDEPFPGIGDRAEYRAVTELLLGVDAELHLTGDGGDEVLTGVETYLAELLRRHPLTALSHLRAYRALNRWSWRTTARALRPPTHRSLITSNARALATELPTTAQFPRDESPAVRAYLPPWATRDALEAVRALLERWADEVRPLASGWAQDEAVRTIIRSGHATRATQQFCDSVGLPMSAPFLDDPVITVCLTVRPEERVTPWQYKPLLVEAMKGVVPDRCLSRTSKSDGASLVVTSIRRHRDKLLALCEGSKLAELGLIDVEPLRAACSTSLWPSGYMPIAFSPTFSCERWLRDLDYLTILAEQRKAEQRKARQ
jgi:asparagine synthase (glutamine-hydrolysing)